MSICHCLYQSLIDRVMRHSEHKETDRSIIIGRHLAATKIYEASVKRGLVDFPSYYGLRKKGEDQRFAPLGKRETVGSITKTLVLFFSISDVIGFSFS